MLLKSETHLLFFRQAHKDSLDVAALSVSQLKLFVHSLDLLGLQLL